MALTNLWGSFFSRVEQGGAMVRPFRRGLFNRVGLNVGAAVPAAQVEPAGLQHAGGGAVGAVRASGFGCALTPTYALRVAIRRLGSRSDPSAGVRCAQPACRYRWPEA